MERKHTRIIEIGFTLLANASLLILGQYLYHCCVSSIGILPLPFTMLFLYCSLSPNLITQRLKVFDCACYPCMRPYDTHKLQYRSGECTFLRYSTSQEGRMFISKGVLFNEIWFRFTITRHVPSNDSTGSSFSSSPPLVVPPALHPSAPQSVSSSYVSPSLVQSSSHS